MITGYNNIFSSSTHITLNVPGKKKLLWSCERTANSTGYN